MPAAARADKPFVCPAIPADPAKAEAFARKLFSDGVELERLDPPNALARYRCAQQAVERPAIALRIGTVEESLGRPAEAADAYERYLELAGDEAPERAQLTKHIRELRASTHAGAATKAESRTPVAAYAALGAGAAFLVAGGVLLGVAKSTSDDVHALPAGTTAWTSDAASGAYGRARTEQTVGIVGLALGAVVAAAGVVLIVRGHAVHASAGPTAHGAASRLTIAF